MAKQVDASSAPGFKSELDLFSTPPTQVAAIGGYVAEYYPQNPVTDAGPYRIVVPKDASVLDLNDNRLFLTLQILAEDGSPVGMKATEAVKVAPINALGATFIQRLIVRLSDKEIYNSGPLYTYQCYLETLLNYGWEAKNSHLQSMLYNKDVGFENMDSEAMKWRGSVFANGNKVVLMAPLYCDLFKQEKYLLSDAELSIEIHRNPNDFCLMSGGEKFKLVVDDLRWYVRKIKLQDSLSMAIENSLLANNAAKYPIRRIKMVTRHIAAGAQAIVENSIFSGQLPRRIIFGMVDAAAFNGSFTKNLLKFEHCNVSDISLKCGDEYFPKHPMRLTWNDYGYTMAYEYLLQTLKMANTNTGCDITINEFRKGYTLFAFDLTPDNVDTGAMQLIREGDLSLYMQLKKPLSATTFPQGIEIVFYGEFDNLIALDSNRTPFFDYSI